MKFPGVAAILAIVATVSSAEDCVNSEEEFTYELNIGTFTNTCAQMALFDTNVYTNRCKKKPVKENCPILCDEECAFVCKNNDSVFSYTSGKGDNQKEKSTTCKEISQQSTESIINKCKKIKIGKFCPGVCNANCPPPEFSCKDFVGKFFYTDKLVQKKTSCEKVELNSDGGARKCKKIEVATMCPGVCDDDCDVTPPPCTNFDTAFVYKSGKKGSGIEKLTTCEKIASSSEKNIANKCKKKEIKANCPAICDPECAAE